MISKSSLSALRLESLEGCVVSIFNSFFPKSPFSILSLNFAFMKDFLQIWYSGSRELRQSLQVHEQEEDWNREG